MISSQLEFVITTSYLCHNFVVVLSERWRALMCAGGLQRGPRAADGDPAAPGLEPHFQQGRADARREARQRFGGARGQPRRRQRALHRQVRLSVALVKTDEVFTKNAVPGTLW